jgi:hypothetical protein
MTTLQEYHTLIDQKGLSGAWDEILSTVFPNSFFASDRLGGLYEDGLAYENKIEKKAMGKYYTPIDVAEVMAKQLLELPGDNICDLCCGTGNLILAVLDTIGKSEATKLLSNGNIYLYDIDETALKICKAILIQKYGTCADNVNIISGDCLSPDVHFPKNSKIISNPPYGKQDSLANSNYKCAKSTRELYVAFMEKVLIEQVPAVIITPHSFLGGSTFKVLREELNACGGRIFAFDNVPANIFNGKKFGIFNSNEANSTRAAITIIEPTQKGFQVAPFIRFRSDDRNTVLNADFLNSLLPDTRQNNKDSILYRIEKGTEDLVAKWLSNSKTLNSLLSSKPTEFKMEVPNTCRYFTTGAKRTLSRSGKLTLYFKDENSFYLGYAFINSSLCYYWHRMCNGGITYPITLLKAMPIFGEVTEQLKTVCDKMMQEEERYIVLKKNAGVYQENIKFPMEYHKLLNILLLQQINAVPGTLLRVHVNSCVSSDMAEDDDDE